MSRDFKFELITLLPRLRRYAIARTGSQDRADDLVQAACERAWKARAQWKPGTRMDYWMFRIMRNLHIDDLRAAAQQGTRADSEVLEDLPDHRWTQKVEGGMTLARVAEAMRELPEPMREVLALVPIEGLSYAEAAEVLEVPIGTVMSRLARARAELMRRLDLTGSVTDETRA